MTLGDWIKRHVRIAKSQLIPCVWKFSLIREFVLHVRGCVRQANPNQLSIVIAVETQ